MSSVDPLKVGFYQVEYVYQNRTQYACYFQLESAQEAMMKMISKGIQVNGLSEYKPNPSIISYQKR